MSEQSWSGPDDGWRHARTDGAATRCGLRGLNLTQWAAHDAPVSCPRCLAIPPDPIAITSAYNYAWSERDQRDYKMIRRAEAATALSGSAILAVMRVLVDEGWVPPGDQPLTFERVSKVNAERCKRWHPGFPDEDDPARAALAAIADTDTHPNSPNSAGWHAVVVSIVNQASLGLDEPGPWSGGDWSNAMCGEAGEAANVVKKLRRLECGFADLRHVLVHDDLVAKLGEELADTILYALLLAAKYDVDVPAAIVAKFNEVSEAQGFPERLP